MTSAQILRGDGVQASFEDGVLHVVRGGQHTAIPLLAVQEVRVPTPRRLDVVLTDGAVHPVEGADPTATAAFAGALTGALPAERGPEASALVVVETRPDDSIDWGWVAALLLPVLGYLGYAVWVGVTHGVRVVGVIVGAVPLVFGALLVFAFAQETYRRVVLRRRGITVPAHAVGKGTKKSTRYVYADAGGADHPYSCTRKTPDILVAYDPLKPARAAHAAPVIEVLGRLSGYLLVASGCLWLGARMAFGLLW
ncbi:hypothetical protein Q5762_22675 [Streptomyces sp. P9(2023)]|uniref:hypothetical protein n=1 Tax=Streptomyces sp. P9(2023) TaxID=3064394 RepID=UPI0028F4200A|nr:hypothetical protein [Streptomyces sp. P9(2023)]MDT9691101.1 hypothetical protein [Streptomyces sp. P9(2023)]